MPHKSLQPTSWLTIIHSGDREVVVITFGIIKAIMGVIAIVES